jgi:hypothetical protein
MNKKEKLKLAALKAVQTRRRRRRKGRARLVRAYAEKLPGTVLGVFWKEFKNLVRGQSGIYVLYKRSLPHYVGKASNLPWRIRVHQRDRLKGKWDTFSFYVIRRAGFLKHMESLLLRIVEPRGARVSGRLSGAEDLREELMDELSRFSKALKELKKSRP